MKEKCDHSLVDKINEVYDKINYIYECCTQEHKESAPYRRADFDNCCLHIRNASKSDPHDKCENFQHLSNAELKRLCCESRKDIDQLLKNISSMTDRMEKFEHFTIDKINFIMTQG